MSSLTIVSSRRLQWLIVFTASFVSSLNAQDSNSKPSSSQIKVFEQKPELMESQQANAKPAQADEVDSKKFFEGATAPDWIWGANENTNYLLSTSFQLPAGTSSERKGRLRVTCDNGCAVRVNSKPVATSNEWQTPIEVDISQFLIDGENRIEASVTNEGSACGFLLQAVVKDGKSSLTIASSKDWKASTTSEPQGVPVRVIAPYGSGPWGNVMDRASTAASQSGLFATLPGFQVERLFTVPKEELGSWVCLAVDPKGRLIASDQEGKGLCRITPSPVGSQEPTKVEKLAVPISSAQGMLFAFDSLYLSVNGGIGSGLYRLKDTDGDDQYDEIKKLKDFRGGGEHGPHALRLSPDGKQIVVLCGNHTDPPFDVPEMKQNDRYRSRIPANWSEDHLLPRMWDANGHAVGRMAPGGWVAMTDPNGETWEIFSIGYRNPYDMDFDKQGELFVYDADMEWDIGAPWYRPTRVTHATSGSEFGWRSGTGKWPTYYADSLPPLVEVGPGSPVGVSFGYGAKFPGKYQNALYICDWTFGTMYAIHMEPSGSSYAGVKEEFLSRTPLPLTDVVIGSDGSMYFTVGGRGTQSELYRVTYVASSNTASSTNSNASGRSDAKSTPQATASKNLEELRKLRLWAESFHGSHAERKKATDQDVQALIAAMGHNDRFIAYAARVALEAQEVSRWQDRIKALDEKNAKSLMIGAIALAHQSNWSTDEIAALLMKVDVRKLGFEDEMTWHRALQLAMTRHGKPSEAIQTKLLSLLEPMFQRGQDEKLPAAKRESLDLIDREIISELIFLESKKVVAQAVASMKGESTSGQDMGSLLDRNRGYGGAILDSLKNQPNQREVHFALMLRNAKVGWSANDKLRYFEWFRKAHGWSGGASYQKFLDNIANESFENSSDTDRLAIESAGLRKAYEAPPLPKPQGPGKDWQLEELVKFAEGGLQQRSLEKGAIAYSAARCVICHRFAGQGGSTGPDLTQAAGRFSQRDLIDSIVNPNRVVSDQYRTTQITTTDGETVIGRVLYEDKERVTLLTDPENANKTRAIPIADIEKRKLSDISVMPKDLLSPLNQEEVMDLLAFLLSKGKSK